MRSGKVWTVFWCLLLLVIMAPLRVVTAPLEGTKDENFYWTGAIALLITHKLSPIFP